MSMFNVEGRCMWMVSVYNETHGRLRAGAWRGVRCTHMNTLPRWAGPIITFQKVKVFDRF